MYLTRPEVTQMNMDAAAKLAKVHFAKRRHARQTSNGSIQGGPERYDRPNSISEMIPPSNPLAVELPAEDVVPAIHNHYGPGRVQFRQTPSLANMKYTVISSDEYPQPVDSANEQRPPQLQNLPYRGSMDGHRRSESSVHTVTSPNTSPAQPQSTQPPPLPPKTPLPYPDSQSPRTFTNMGSIARSPPRGQLPYPDTDGPPPAINLARKPEFGVR